MTSEQKEKIRQLHMKGVGGQTVAAITIAYRVDSVLFLPISTLVAQETGAGNKETAKKIFKIGTVILSFISVRLTFLYSLWVRHEYERIFRGNI